MGKRITARRKWLSTVVGVGLAVASLGTASAQTTGAQQGAPQDTAQFCAGFRNYASQNWSQLGFSSAEQARQVLGSDWWAQQCAGLLATANPQAGPDGGQQASAQAGPLNSADGATNLVDQNERAFGAYGPGQMEDDEANGSIQTGNDSQGQEEDDDEKDDQAEDGNNGGNGGNR